MEYLDLFSKDSTEICIGFLGGSITEGTDRATPGHFYVDIVGNKFKEKFPNKNVKIINAGWGGTGSDYGLFRLQADICNASPDIVFVEFACNDVVQGSTSCILHMDNIVQQLLSLPKIPYICFIYTTDKNYNTRIKEHELVASHYNIPSVNLLDHIRKLINNCEIEFNDIFGDDIHPNNYGYQIYSDYIIKQLFSKPEIYFCKPNKALPLTAPQIKNPHFVPNTEAQLLSNWETCPIVNKHLPPCISSSVGGKLRFEFSGTCIGILCEDMYTLGVSEFVIDNEIKGYFSAEPYKPALFIYNLKSGKHMLEINVISAESIHIAGFLVSE